MGTTAIPTQPIVAPDSWLDLFSLMRENTDFVLHHANFAGNEWEQFAEGVNVESVQSIESANFITGMAELNGLKLFLVADPLESVGRQEIQNLPVSVGTNFGDKKVRTAYKNFVVRFAQDYQPEYMGLFSEVNTYIKNHPEELDNVISLHKEAYDLIKGASPNTIVTTTFQYEELSGTVDGTSEWDVFESFEPLLDVVSITTYPSPWFDNPEGIPDNYYSQLKYHTNKTVIIAESGWPTGGEPQFHGSEANQEQFIRKIVELTNGLDLKLWIWWFIHDWDGEGYSDFFKTMGLRTSDGTEKPSFSVWKNIHDIPLIS